MGRNGPPWQSVGTQELLGNWKVNRSADASFHIAALEVLGGESHVPGPLAQQECLRGGNCSLTPSAQAATVLLAVGQGGTSLSSGLAHWGHCAMEAETGQVLPL